MTTPVTADERMPQPGHTNGRAMLPKIVSWPEFQKKLRVRAKQKKPASLHKRFGGKKYALMWGVPAAGEQCPERNGGQYKAADASVTMLLKRACKLLDGRRQIKRKDAALLQYIGIASGTASQSPSHSITSDAKHQTSASIQPHNATIDSAARTFDSTQSVQSFESAVLIVAVASLLPGLAAVCSKHDWLVALKSLITLAGNGCGDGENALVRQLISIELPLVLASQLPEIEECVALAETAFDVLVVEQEELLDSDGAIRAAESYWVPAFLATWTRSLVLARQMKFRFDAQSRAKWEWFVRFAMRLLRRDGTSMLANPAIRFNLDLYQAALKTSRDKDDHAIARALLPGGNPKNKKTSLFDERGCFSQWAGLGVLQTDWSPRSARLALAIDGRDFRLEVCRGVRLFEINGLPDISINGKTLLPVSSWEDLCWHSDEDVDYIELEIDLEGGIRLTRQVCLIRDDEVMFMADAILGNSVERIDYRLNLSLPDSVSPMQELENTEIYLRDNRFRSLVLPLVVPEWKSARTDDRLACSASGVSLQQSRLANNLYAPLFVDLRPNRCTEPRTWRSLTVAETLEIISPDVAQAFRVRIGDDQWVVYRSLEATANRTFLGQNQNSEFFIGRMQGEGDVKTLLAIEP